MNEGRGPKAEGGIDAQLRVLASAILYRACLRALAASPSAPGPKPSALDKMALHARVEEAAWGLPATMVREVEGRDVDDGVPEGEAWQELVRRLVSP